MAKFLNPQDMRIISEITKAEPQADGSLLVQGNATSEDLDADGEIMDYEAAKAAMLAWRGNVREQHDPHKAVGRALEVLPDDEKRSIPIKVMVSAGARDTQQKVLDGTLKFFSIGGRAKAKELDKVVMRADGKPATRVMLERISEVSLVDSGSNPASEASVVKAEGEQLLAVGLAEDEVEKGGNKPGEGDKPYGDVKYADPGYRSDAKKRYPVDTEEHIRAAWNYISKPKNAGKYKPEDLKKVKSKIVSAWKDKIDKEGPPSAKKVDVADDVAKADGMEILDARAALEALATIESCADSLRALIGVEDSEEENEAGQVEALTAAVDALESASADVREFIAAEIQEDEAAMKAARDSDIAKINKPSIKQEGGKYKVVDTDGHVYGTHDTEGEAKKQLAALYAAKEKADDRGAKPGPEGAAKSEDVTPPA